MHLSLYKMFSSIIVLRNLVILLISRSSSEETVSNALDNKRLLAGDSGEPVLVPGCTALMISPIRVKSWRANCRMRTICSDDECGREKDPTWTDGMLT